MRTIPICFAMIAAGLLASVWNASHRTPEPGPAIGVAETGVVVEHPVRDLGALKPGEHNLSFKVTNNSSRPAEVVGYPTRCGPTGCFVARDKSRIRIPPGESVEIEGVFGVPGTGPFEFEGDLFLNDGGTLRAVPLRITGTVQTGQKQ